MENQIFRDVNTGLDLNGPILSIVQEPESVTGIGTTVLLANWKLLSPPGGTSVTPSLGSIKSKQDEPNTFYIWQSTIAPADPRTYFKKSVDGGETWTDISNIDHRIRYTNSWDVNNDVVIILTDQGESTARVFRSADGCQSWNMIDLEPIIEDINPTQAYSPNDLGSGILNLSNLNYLGANKWMIPINEQGIGLVSTDNGVTWSNITADYTSAAGPFGGPSFLTDTSRFGMIGRPSAASPHVWTGTAPDNLDTSFDMSVAGSTDRWPSTVAYSSVGGGVLVAASPYYWWLSEDDGVTWGVFDPIPGKGHSDPSNDMPTQITSIDGVFFAANESEPFVQEFAYTQQNESFWYSTDGGTSWTYQISANYAMGSIVRSNAGVYAAFTGVGVGGTSYLQTATIPYDRVATNNTVEFVGIATAKFPVEGIGINSGTIAYQWYQEGVGALSDSTYITGAATSTLTVSGLVTPDDDGNGYYVQADYVPTYSGVGETNLGMGYKTGNAINEPIQSGIAKVNVTPLIEIIAQPSNVSTLVDTSRTISINATLTDNSYADDLTYEWLRVDNNGNAIPITGDIVSTTTTTIEGEKVTVETPVSQSYSQTGIHNIPTTAKDITITLAGAKGGSGGGAAGASGGGGGAGMGGNFTVPNAYRGTSFGFYIGYQGSDGTGGVHNSGAGSGGSGHPGGGSGANSGTDNSGRDGSAAGSGAGGGGGGASQLLVDNSRFVIAAGGGGGGGATHGLNAPGGSGGSPWFGPPVDEKGGGNGEQGSGWEGAGGGGGGGGGANKPGTYVTRGYGDGGQAGHSNWNAVSRELVPASAGIGGEGGASAYNTAFTFTNSWNNSGNGSASISYTDVTTQTTADIVTEVTNTLKCSGFNTKTLTLEADYETVQNIQCRVSSATASNGPVYSDIAVFGTYPNLGESEIVIETLTVTPWGTTSPTTGLDDAGSSAAVVDSVYLNLGEHIFEAVATDTEQDKLYSFYSPNGDIEVEMDLYGGKGKDFVATPDFAAGSGGEGGFSRIRFTMKQNTEYILAGLTYNVNTPFLYEKSRLMAVVGEGGHATHNSDGGDGGGIGVAGNSAPDFTATSGNGGVHIGTGNLTNFGTFGSAFDAGSLHAATESGQPRDDGGPGTNQDTQADGVDGGQTVQCSKGHYWYWQGISHCADLPATAESPGGGKFRLWDGTVVTNTTDTIQRGYKAGYNIMQTAGAATLPTVHRPESGGRPGQNAPKSGRGGNGATGGQGGQLNDGGGGGSGYTDGSVFVDNTRQGGSTLEQARVVMRIVS